jgi:enoyl-CoA hydratase/carnithine racemase
MNVLSIGAGVVPDLLAALEAMLADPDVSGIVIAGCGTLFSAGADIKDFERDLSEVDGLRTLFDRIEGAPKPIVAAIHGMALGGGLELALACHYRIAAANTKFGLPEVTLGILPGGGGTQRLPRLVPPQDALTMMTGGKSIDTNRALAIGLIDRIAEGDVVEAALALLANQPQVRPTGAAATIFNGATRFHSGGLPGLSADEVPAILQKGEEVLSKADPRNILNGGGSGAAPAPTGNLKVESYTYFDKDAMLNDYLNSAAGTKRIIGLIRDNSSAVRGALS